MGDDHIGVEHLLLGLLAEEEDIAASVLAELGVTADGVRRELASRRAPAVFGPAEAEALESIGTEHVLLGLTRAADEPAAGVLRALQAPPEAIRAGVLAKLRKAS